MKIDLASIDREQFMVHEHILFGEVVYLVQPQHIGCKWTQANKHLRSAVFNSEGELISMGFPKFTNWSENPDNFPVPTSLNGCKVMEKLDGSLLIVSKYKGQFILRTRGTINAENLDNGHELALLKQKYPEIFKFQSCGMETWPFSLLFEWVSPINRIVLSYGDEADFILVGGIYHDKCILWDQEWLDAMAKGFGCKRPITYNFPSVDDLIANVDQWKGKEGVVIYSKDGQALHKVKSAWYLVLHRMKESLSSIDKVVDVWFVQGKLPYQEFEEYITSTFDWELWNQIRGEVSQICDGWKEVQRIVQGMKSFVEPLNTWSRKDAAKKIIDSYGITNRSSFCFQLLDGKELCDDALKKLLWQVLKK